MILTDREIASALKHGHINIIPAPTPDAYSSTSVDLTLANKFAEWEQTDGVLFRPGAKNYKYTNLIKYQTIHTQNQYTLKPNSLTLAWTAEEVRIPVSSRLAARVEGKSSMARIGVGVHITAPTIHCGFEAPIQLEMYNFGPHEVVLDAGMRICQLIFEQTFGTPEAGYQGLFQGQRPA